MLDILTKAGSYIAIIILGYVLRKVGFFGEETFGVLSKITLKITLPAAIISGFAGKQVDPALVVQNAGNGHMVACHMYQQDPSAAKAEETAEQKV